MMSLIVVTSYNKFCIYHVKMPTIVGIFIFMRRINFVLSRVEYEKCFITLGPDLGLLCLQKR